MMSLIENGNIHKMLIFNKEGEKLIEKQLCVTLLVWFPFQNTPVLLVCSPPKTVYLIYSALPGE